MDSGWAPCPFGRSRTGWGPESSLSQGGNPGQVPLLPRPTVYFWIFDLSNSLPNVPFIPTVITLSLSFTLGLVIPQNGKSLLIPFLYCHSYRIYLYLLSFSQWIIISFVNLCWQASLLYSLTQLTSSPSISNICLCTYLFVLSSLLLCHSFNYPLSRVHYWSIIGDAYNRTQDRCGLCLHGDYSFLGELIMVISYNYDEYYENDVYLW